MSSDVDMKEIDEALGLSNYPIASVTYTLVSPKGYGLLFTVRRNDEGELLEVMEDLENSFSKRGYQAGKGGNYTPKPSESASDGATDAQIRLLKKLDLFKEGISKSEASAKISTALGNK